MYHCKPCFVLMEPLPDCQVAKLVDVGVNAKKTIKKSVKGKKAKCKGKCKFKCQLCTKTFFTANGCYKHMRTHSPGKYKCKTCHKKFQFPKQLAYQILVHSPAQKIPCRLPTCDKVYSSKTAMEYHFGIHSGGSFKCR